jgi:glucose-1-phosphate adenylyltransferase
MSSNTNRITRQSLNTSNVLCVIMGGGQGSRLFPLTKDRAKPAVPFAGKYRIVDVPISNCINSGFRRIYVLTQFNSTSLHRHISQSYKFDQFSSGFVEILAAQQTFSDTSWYEGTADAVRKNLLHFLDHDFEYLLILSGDQLYRMDFRRMIAEHRETGADVTIATIPVPRKEASALGIMQIAEDRRIVRFVEKPKDVAVQDSLRLPKEWYSKLDIEGDEESFLASMGIYIFNREVVKKLLDNEHSDFGKHIIPRAIETHRVCSHIFQGYWEDIGTIRAFFESNLDMAAELPHFNFFDMSAPIFSRPRFLPGSKVNGAQIDHAVISDGCIITDASLERCVIGIRSVIDSGAVLRNVVMMGADYYEAEAAPRSGTPPVGIGRNTTINDAIVDKNARIGERVVISPEGKPSEYDGDNFFIRDGIVIIPKNAVIPDGSWI